MTLKKSPPGLFESLKASGGEIGLPRGDGKVTVI